MIEFINELIAILQKIEPYVTGSNGAVLASFAIIVLMVHGVKAVVKYLEFKGVLQRKFPWYDETLRRWFIRLCAFIIGVVVVLVLVDKPDAWKWAIGMGFLNPVILKIMIARAEKKQWIYVLSILKMRRVITVKDEETGEEHQELETTQMLYGQDLEKAIEKELDK